MPCCEGKLTYRLEAKITFTFTTCFYETYLSNHFKNYEYGCLLTHMYVYHMYGVYGLQAAVSHPVGFVN